MRGFRAGELGWRLPGDPEVRFLPVDIVNDARKIAENRHFVSINGATAVDLYGQVALPKRHAPEDVPRYYSLIDVAPFPRPPRPGAEVVSPTGAQYDHRHAIDLLDPEQQLPSGFDASDLRRLIRVLEREC